MSHFCHHQSVRRLLHGLISYISNFRWFKSTQMVYIFWCRLWYVSYMFRKQAMSLKSPWEVLSCTYADFDRAEHQDICVLSDSCVTVPLDNLPVIIGSMQNHQWVDVMHISLSIPCKIIGDIVCKSICWLHFFQVRVPSLLYSSDWLYYTQEALWQFLQDRCTCCNTLRLGLRAVEQ